jgi:hypothetical protein
VDWTNNGFRATKAEGMSEFQIEESTVTPTGTQASFIKENPERLKAVFRDESSEIDVSFDNELPAAVQLGMIPDPAVQVILAIPVEIRHEGDIYVASWEQAEEFGYGANRSEALHDFGRTIARLFITLNREKDTLGPSLIDTLNLLRNHLKFRAHEDARI